MDVLSAIFGGEARVKILRLFLFNPDSKLTAEEIADRAKCRPDAVRKEIKALLEAGAIKKRGSIKGHSYHLDPDFPYLEPLKNLLITSSVKADQYMLKRFSKAGRLKLLVASGVFIQNWDSRVDILIVGDSISLPRIESVIRDIEAELGKEIAYSAFETQDFEYRMGIHDRLVRDIMDYPHVTLIDRLGIDPE
ncbi:MAG: winged helix-turn-helix transcriptional regulator [Patescibacteria group bacterium]|nr:winged helix-turn-helix transcriptional regulator [Patescibacteria group bacterium]